MDRRNPCKPHDDSVVPSTSHRLGALLNRGIVRETTPTTTTTALRSLKQKRTMVVSSMLVNVADDAELRLVNLLAEATPANLKSDSFVSMCESSISGGDAVSLVKTVIGDAGAMAAMLILESSDSIAALTVLAALLERAETDKPSEGKGLAEELADAVSKAESDNVNVQAALERKITLLSTLYNIRSSTLEKVALLNKMVQLAGADAATLLNENAPLGKLLKCTVDEDGDSRRVFSAPPSPQIVTLLDSWDISAEARRPLLKSICAALPSGDSRKQRFLLLLIATYKDGSVDAEGATSAREAAIGAVRDPISLFSEQRNLLSQPPIQSLSKSDAELLELLKILQEGILADYESFMASKGGAEKLLKAYDLDPTSCQKNMRILSLCSLAAEHEEIPYRVVAETLKLPSESDVESWVIAAVGSGLVEAKMDQLSQKVMVERCVVRKFDMAQWKALQGRLSQWKESVGGILSGLKQSQVAAASLHPLSVEL